MAVLVLVAFDLTRALGFPADALTVERADSDGFAVCLATAASPDVVALNREIVEIWRLDPEADEWWQRMTKVAALEHGQWIDGEGELLDVDQFT